MCENEKKAIPNRSKPEHQQKAEHLYIATKKY